MGLPKPERVEVGQWWTIADDPPWRIEDRDGWEWLVDQTHPGHTNLSLYLGSGEHPKLSDETIEMLAEHAYHVNGGRTDVFPPEIAESYRALVLRVPLDGPDCVRPERELAIRSMYKILRSLGKW